MATPTQLRSRIAGLTKLASRDLGALWRSVSTAAQARVALNDVLPALVETYGVASAAVAAEWYDEARAKAGIGGSFRAAPAVIADTTVPSLIGWATTEAASLDTMLPLIEGGVQRRIANVSRITVTRSTLTDKKAGGWQRTGTGECAFCAMLIGRGAVYSEATADFAAHDNCHCQATPVWRDRPKPVQPYTPSARNHSDADRARVREWIANHDAGRAGLQATPSGGFASLSRVQLEKQLSITEGLKGSAWRTAQLKRLRGRLDGM